MKKVGFVIPVIFALAVFLAAGAGGTALGSRGGRGTSPSLQVIK